MLECLESISQDPEAGGGVVIGPVTFSAALLRATEKVLPVVIAVWKSTAVERGLSDDLRTPPGSSFTRFSWRVACEISPQQPLISFSQT